MTHKKFAIRIPALLFLLQANAQLFSQETPAMPTTPRHRIRQRIHKASHSFDQFHHAALLAFTNITTLSAIGRASSGLTIVRANSGTQCR